MASITLTEVQFNNLEIFDLDFEHLIEVDSPLSLKIQGILLTGFKGTKTKSSYLL